MYKVPTEDGVASPAFEITINGEEIPYKYYKLINSVSYESHHLGSDMVTIEFSDPDLGLIDSGVLFKGVEITVRGGWYGDMDDWLVPGYVSLVDGEFEDTGRSGVVIHCMDESFQLNRKWVEASYEESTFSDMAQQIAMLYGLDTEGPTTTMEHSNVAQTHETDIELLDRMAEDENLVYGIKNGTIWWEYYENALGTDDAQASFVWKDTPFNLIDFNPRVSVGEVPDEIEEEDIDDASKDEIQGKTDREMREGLYSGVIFNPTEGSYQIADFTDVDAFTAAAPEEEEEYTPDGEKIDVETKAAPPRGEVERETYTPELEITDDGVVLDLDDTWRAIMEEEEGEEPDDEPVDDSKLQEMVDRILEKKRFNIDGRANVIPIPFIRAGKPVKISNVGRRFSGKYGVTQAEHTINSNRGYTLELTLTRNRLSADELEDLPDPAEQTNRRKREKVDLLQTESDDGDESEDSYSNVDTVDEDTLEETSEKMSTDELDKLISVRDLRDGATRLEETYGIPRRVTIAQAILESGWGRHTPEDRNSGEESHNLFGIKWTEDSGYDYVESRTREVDEDGNEYYEIAKFRKYRDYDESIEDYGSLLGTNTDYTHCLDTDDEEEYVNCIHEAGYATDPEYPDKIMNLIERNVNL